MEVTATPRLEAYPVAVWAPHPITPSEGRELRYEAFLPGETVLEYLERTGLMARLGNAPVELRLDGRRLPESMWPYVMPRPGVHLQIAGVMHGGGGGGGGKNPLASILMIAVMIFAPYIGAFMGITSNIGLAVLRLGLGLAINALFPPPKPQISAAQGQANQQASPTYALTGGANAARPYDVMPMFCGKNLVYPDLGAKTYTELIGDDQYLYQLFDYGYNDLVLSNPRIGTTPVSSYSEIRIQDSVGGAITLFPANVDTVSGGDLPDDVWVQRTSSADTTQLAIEVVGQSFRMVSEDGNTYGNAYSFYVEYRPQGTLTWLDFFPSGHLFDGQAPNKIKTLRFVWRRDVPKGAYDVRVVFHNNMGPSYEGVNITANFTWSQLRCYQPDTGDYTGRQRQGMEARATGQLSGQVEIYNVEASAKTQVWNGAAWVLKETSNPAWWVLAIARGRFETMIDGRRVKVWGAGEPDARIDIEGLKAFAAWCDLKKLTFNAIFDQSISAREMMAAAALAGRGTLTDVNGKIGVVWDAPDQPVVTVFTMSNILVHTFRIEYQTEKLADEIIGSFINPELNWQRDTVRVVVPGVTSPVNSKSIELFGFTNKDQTARATNLYAAQAVYRNKKYYWQVDYEGMVATRGDVVILAHDLAMFDYSGRLKPGSTAAMLVLDRDVPLTAEGGYVLVVKPNQSYAAYRLAGGAGTSNTLIPASPLPFNPGADPDHPPIDYKYIYGFSSLPGRKVKIDAIRTVSGSKREISAVDEFAEFYPCENNPYSYNPPRPQMGLPSISGLALSVEGVRAGTGYFARVTATWTAQNDYARAVVYVEENGDGLRFVEETPANASIFNVTDRQTIRVRVVAFSSLGGLGGRVTAEVTQFIDFAGLTRPSDVKSLRISGTRLSWNAVADPDVVGYRARYHYGDRRVWEDAAPMHEGLITNNPWPMPMNLAGQVTIMLKAVDAAGLESVSAAVIVTDFGDADIANVIVTRDFAAASFPGTITGGALVAGELRANGITKLYNPDRSAPFYNANRRAPFYPVQQYGELAYETVTYRPSAVLAGSVMTLELDVAGGPYYVEYRQIAPTPFYKSDRSAAFYNPDRSAPFYAPAGDYRPWPGSIIVKSKPYQFRIRTAQGAVRGVIRAITAVIDAPDLEQFSDDLVVPAGGLRVPLTVGFTQIQNVQLTLQESGTGATGVHYRDKAIDGSDGPLIECVNAAGVPVDGIVDVRLKGY
jgi:hypothetical protein